MRKLMCLLNSHSLHPIAHIPTSQSPQSTSLLSQSLKRNQHSPPLKSSNLWTPSHPSIPNISCIKTSMRIIHSHINIRFHDARFRSTCIHRCIQAIFSLDRSIGSSVCNSIGAFLGDSISRMRIWCSDMTWSCIVRWDSSVEWSSYRRKSVMGERVVIADIGAGGINWMNRMIGMTWRMWRMWISGMNGMNRMTAWR